MGVWQFSAIALSALTACSFSHGIASGDIDADDRDGSGVIDAAIDAIPDGSPNVDSDGDGVLDSVDNCWNAANPDQANFDGDPFGDVCDGCPHISTPANLDGDQDGVGDACDPRPTVGTDTRVLWTTFSNSTDLTGWYDGNTGGTGVWQLGVGGGLAQVTANPGQYASWASPGTWQHVYVATSFIIGTPQATATIGVCSGWDGTSFDCCNVNDRSGTAFAEAQTQTSQFTDTTWTPGITAAQRVDITQTVTASSNDCAFSGSAGATATRSTQPNAISAHVLFYMAHTTATFRYLFVVTIGQ